MAIETSVSPFVYFSKSSIFKTESSCRCTWALVMLFGVFGDDLKDLGISFSLGSI